MKRFRKFSREKVKEFHKYSREKVSKSFFNRMSLFSDAAKLAVDPDDTDDEGAPQISLQEMLDDLHITEDATGEEGADMME